MAQWSKEEFLGKIGKTVEESTPWWSTNDLTASNKPNVLLILLDDLGFAQLGCYGSDISTPNIDELARDGLRYNNFHTTALCSPSRASLLTGRHPQSAGISKVTAVDSGFPNSRGKVAKDTALLSEMLVDEGYNTFAVGKWHLAPASEHSFAGPFDNWPLGRGFDHFYGFLSGATNQWNPDLVEDNRRIKQPARSEDGYHLTEDLTDKAIEYISAQNNAAPDKPFFCYLSYGAVHAPHHAPKEFIDKYKGKYDKGWDKTREEWFQRQKGLGIIPSSAKLPPRNPDVEAWDELSPDEKRLYARMQEAFAGFLEHTDYHIGRLLDYLKETGQLDETLIVFLSDNGACAMGGEEGTVNNWATAPGNMETLETKVNRIDEIGTPLSDNHYPKGWAQVGNTPLRWYKSFVHAGGVKDPLIIRYPEKIKDIGGIREQYHHLNDIVPTILEIIGAEAPKVYKGVPQKPLDGISMTYTFDQQNSLTRKKLQIYEMVGNRALYKEGWKAVARHIPGLSFEDDDWELFYLEEDYSELNNLANDYPEKLQELIELWWKEAEKNNFLPLDGRNLIDQTTAKKKKNSDQLIERVYYPSQQGLPLLKAPDIRNKSFEIQAEVNRPDKSAEGVLVAFGGRANGYSFFVQDNRLIFAYNRDGISHSFVSSDVELPVGFSVFRFRYIKVGENEGICKLLVGDKLIGESMLNISAFLPFTFGLFNIGENAMTPVVPLYDTPFTFSGELKRVVYKLGNPELDTETIVNMELTSE